MGNKKFIKIIYFCFVINFSNFDLSGSLVMRKLAPSGRELPTESGEGERGTILSTKYLRHVGSFHRKRSPSLSEGGKDAVTPI